MAFLIAVDGGGTSCRAVIASIDGTPLGEGLAGSANIVTDLEMARDNIVEATRRAARQAGIPEDRIAESAAVLGLAGANIGNYPSRIAARLPFRISHVETDARIALQGALGEIDGAVAVVGTGSVFMSRRHGRIRSVGGWGPAVGDFCSGARLGRTLLEEALRAYDALRGETELTRKVLGRYDGDPSILVEFAQSARPRDFAGFAPSLFEYADRGDAVAVEIVSAAVAHLEETLQALVGADGLPFCLLGGLASNYSKRLSAATKGRERTPEGNALSGALSMAISMFGQAQEGVRIHG
jgi:glucosamine kinase